MKTIVSCLMLVMTFSLMSLADAADHAVNIQKNSPSFHVREFTDVILLPTKGIRNVGMIEKAQQQYIKKLYPDHHVVLSVYVKDQKGRYIEAVSCVNNENEMVQVYFDMSNVYQYLKGKNGETKMEVEKLESSYMTVQ